MFDERPSLLPCTDIFFLGDLDEGIEKNTKDENKDNEKEAGVWNLERNFSDDDPEEEDYGERVRCCTF